MTAFVFHAILRSREIEFILDRLPNQVIQGTALNDVLHNFGECLILLREELFEEVDVVDLRRPTFLLPLSFQPCFQLLDP